jgi:hypothetical protein
MNGITNRYTRVKGVIIYDLRSRVMNLLRDIKQRIAVLRYD